MSLILLRHGDPTERQRDYCERERHRVDKWNEAEGQRDDSQNHTGHRESVSVCRCNGCCSRMHCCTHVAFFLWAALWLNLDGRIHDDSIVRLPSLRHIWSKVLNGPDERPIYATGLRTLSVLLDEAQCPIRVFKLGSGFDAKSAQSACGHPPSRWCMVLDSFWGNLLCD